MTEELEKLRRDVADKLLTAILKRTSWDTLNQHGGIMGGSQWPWYVTEQIKKLKDAGMGWEEYT